MTLAEFYALRSSPQAIILPRRTARSRAASHAAEAVAAARSEAKSTVSAALPEKGSADKKH